MPDDASKTDDRLEPHLLIVLGGTGDLMHRKLLPSLFRLRPQGVLREKSVLLAASLGEAKDDEAYRRWVRDALSAAGVDAKQLRDWPEQCVYYQPLDKGDGYRPLAERVKQLEKQHDLPGNRVIYLAIPNEAFPTAVEQLGAAGLNESSGWVRLVIEKPFGHDVDSAQELNRQVHRRFDESQVYRIDHYLGKETVQNLAIFRFANMLFESAWNRNHVDNVQITVAEDLGVEQRAAYYEQAGAVRDMLQNHGTQLLTLIAMDAPPRFDADAVRDEKLRVLRSIDPLTAEDAVFGQYASGEVDGDRVPGYLEEDAVAADSRTETYAALRLSIDNWRWQGVPFFLRTGKRLPRKVTEIAIVFREPPVCLFEPLGACSVDPDVLRIRLQPDEAFSLTFDVKKPGEPLTLEEHALEFRYADAFDRLPGAYESLLLDVLVGDQTHFVRADEVEASWRMYAPLLDDPPKPCSYPAGSWGPREADALLGPEAKAWRTS